jgi:hypothetical protein
MSESKFVVEEILVLLKSKGISEDTINMAWSELKSSPDDPHTLEYLASQLIENPDDHWQIGEAVKRGKDKERASGGSGATVSGTFTDLPSLQAHRGGMTDAQWKRWLAYNISLRGGKAPLSFKPVADYEVALLALKDKTVNRSPGTADVARLKDLGAPALGYRLAQLGVPEGQLVNTPEMLAKQLAELRSGGRQAPPSLPPSVPYRPPSPSISLGSRPTISSGSSLAGSYGVSQQPAISLQVGAGGAGVAGGDKLFAVQQLMIAFQKVGEGITNLKTILTQLKKLGYDFGVPVGEYKASGGLGRKPPDLQKDVMATQGWGILVDHVNRGVVPPTFGPASGRSSSGQSTSQLLQGLSGLSGLSGTSNILQPPPAAVAAVSSRSGTRMPKIGTRPPGEPRTLASFPPAPQDANDDDPHAMYLRRMEAIKNTLLQRFDNVDSGRDTLDNIAGDKQFLLQQFLEDLVYQTIMANPGLAPPSKKTKPILIQWLYVNRNKIAIYGTPMRERLSEIQSMSQAQVEARLRAMGQTTSSRDDLPSLQSRLAAYYSARSGNEPSESGSDGSDSVYNLLRTRDYATLLTMVPTMGMGNLKAVVEALYGAKNPKVAGMAFTTFKGRDAGHLYLMRTEASKLLQHAVNQQGYRPPSAGPLAVTQGGALSRPPAVIMAPPARGPIQLPPSMQASGRTTLPSSGAVIAAPPAVAVSGAGVMVGPTVAAATAGPPINQLSRAEKEAELKVLDKMQADVKKLMEKNAAGQPAYTIDQKFDELSAIVRDLPPKYEDNPLLKMTQKGMAVPMMKMFIETFINKRKTAGSPYKVKGEKYHVARPDFKADDMEELLDIVKNTNRPEHIVILQEVADLMGLRPDSILYSMGEMSVTLQQSSDSVEELSAGLTTYIQEQIRKKRELHASGAQYSPFNPEILSKVKSRRQRLAEEEDAKLAYVRQLEEAKREHAKNLAAIEEAKSMAELISAAERVNIQLDTVLVPEIETSTLASYLAMDFDDLVDSGGFQQLKDTILGLESVKNPQLVNVPIIAAPATDGSLRPVAVVPDEKKIALPPSVGGAVSGAVFGPSMPMLPPPPAPSAPLGAAPPSILGPPPHLLGPGARPLPPSVDLQNREITRANLESIVLDYRPDPGRSAADSVNACLGRI